MNLMDMLSGDSPNPIFQDNDASDMQSILDNAAGPNEVHESIEDDELSLKNDQVYYLPTVLTNMQKELSEIVLRLLKPVLLNEAKTTRQRASINSLLDNNDEGASNELDGAEKWNNSEKINLLFDQLRIINKHPSLLVDHFIPKNLLLLEINERLVNLSGKFQLFNRIINSLIDRYPSHKSDDKIPNDGFHILVIAESVKELELIEGLIIGKNLYYKNLSGRKLYDDNKPMPSYQKQINVVEDSNSGSDTKPRRRYNQHHNGHRNKKNNDDTGLHLYLVTSQHVYNNYTPSSTSGNSGFNLIISFDNNLDTKNPSIEIIRSRKEFDSLASLPLKTPILMPTPVFTIDHILLEYPLPPSTNEDYFYNRNSSNPLVKWKGKVLNAFVVNRFKLFDEIDSNFFCNTYGSNMAKLYKWFHRWDTIKFPLHEVLQKFNDSLILHYSDDKLLKKLETDYLEEFKGPYLPVSSYEDFKHAFADNLNHRLIEIDDILIVKLQKKLPQYRERETKRQLILDIQEEAVADNYRKLRKLNEDASISEKKLDRVITSLTKLEASKSELTERYHHLQEVRQQQNSGHQDIVAQITLQDKTITELKEELQNLESEYEKLAAENDDIRVNYQNSSGIAVQLSSKLDSIKDKGQQYNLKLSRSGIKALPTLIKKDDLINYEQLLARLTKENNFITLFFEDKVDRLIKERSAILDNTASGSSSRPSNRISRASTPF